VPNPQASKKKKGSRESQYKKKFKPTALSIIDVVDQQLRAGMGVRYSSLCGSPVVVKTSEEILIWVKNN